MSKVNVFWFRRDLRLFDNHGLSKAISQENKVLPIFIFDEEILSELPADDARVNFIYDNLKNMNVKLQENEAGLKIYKGNVPEVWKKIVEEYSVEKVFTNHDYEPYAISRDKEIGQFLKSKNIEFLTFKDQVIFEKEEVLKDDGDPYTVYTPYKNKWLSHFKEEFTKPHKVDLSKENFVKSNWSFPSKSDLSINSSSIEVKPYDLDVMVNYGNYRDYPAMDRTSYLSPHLRFGTVSVRELVKQALHTNKTFLSELIWREFFMQILYHFPKVVHNNFREKYDGVKWRNNEQEFEKWCKGETGYPIVDAGMRQLNETGYMHNRVRMIVASFLCKHLLIDWKWGEAYFAKKLLDYELASNNGNWQWAAGTGCDAAPYFRVFNPHTQIKKFDEDLEYINKWVKDLNELTYPTPMVEHKSARERALKTYKDGLG